MEYLRLDLEANNICVVTEGVMHAHEGKSLATQVSKVQAYQGQMCNFLGCLVLVMFFFFNFFYKCRYLYLFLLAQPKPVSFIVPSVLFPVILDAPC